MSRVFRRAGILALMSALAILLLPQTEEGGFEVARAQFAGRVAGVVVNGTQGASVPEGFEVVLITTDPDGNPVGQRTTKVDAKGVFEFTDVPGGDDVLNRLVIDYQGVISTVRLEDEVVPANLELRIHETTHSFDTISVVNQVLVVRPDGPSRLMGFLELVTVRNTSDRTFVADLTDPNVTGLSMVRFALPENYEGFTGISVDPPLPAGSILEAGPGFAITNPVPPGEFKIFFDYFVRYEGNSLEFSRNLPFGAGEVRVLVPKGSGQVSGGSLAAFDDVTLGETEYTVARGTEYARGDRVDLKFAGLPQPSLMQSTRNRLQDSATYVKIGVPVAAGVVLAGLLAYVFLVRRRKPSASPGTAVAQNATEAPPSSAGDRPAIGDREREALVREIAALDQQYEAGEIEEAEYRKRRGDLTSRALGSTRE